MLQLLGGERLNKPLLEFFGVDRSKPIVQLVGADRLSLPISEIIGPGTLNKPRPRPQLRRGGKT